MRNLWSLPSFRFAVGFFSPFFVVKGIMLWIGLGATLVGFTPAWKTLQCTPHDLCDPDAFFALCLLFAGPVFGLFTVFSEHVEDEITLIGVIKNTIWVWIIIFWEFFVFSPAIISPSTDNIAFWRLPAILSFTFMPVLLVIFLASVFIDRKK
jgi:hypothetical protein